MVHETWKQPCPRISSLRHLAWNYGFLRFHSKCVKKKKNQALDQMSLCKTKTNQDQYDRIFKIKASDAL